MTRRRLEFGILLNNRAATFLDNYPMSRLLDAATLSEELGYDSVWVGESWLARPRYEPVTTLAAIAMRTQRVRVGSAILQPQFRNPVWLALTWATLDVISSGRSILGVGIGGGPPHEKEYEVGGFRREERGKVFEECVEVLKRLWTEEKVSYEGAYFRLRDISLGYRPIQKPHPPIWIASGIFIYWASKMAGSFRGTLERVARLADGWMVALTTPSEFGEAWEKVKELARSYGRRPEDIHPALNIWMNLDHDPGKAIREGKVMLEKYHRGEVQHPGTLERCFFCTPGECVKRLEPYIALGAKSLMISLKSLDPTRQIKRFVEEVMPSF